MKYLCHDINGQPHLVDEMDLHDHISVYAIIRDGNKILLVSQLDHNSERYDFPGGGLDKNEDIFVGLGRELYEETNLALESIDKKICEFTEFYYDLRSMTGWRSICQFYSVTASGKLNSNGNGDDIGAAKFFTSLSHSDVNPIIRLVLANI